MTKIKFITLFLVIFFVIGYLAKNYNDRTTLEYGLNHPATYRITFTNNRVDTVTVWSTIPGDMIMHYYEGMFGQDRQSVFQYTPYSSKYTEKPDTIVKVYNVCKYKRI